MISLNDALELISTKVQAHRNGHARFTEILPLDAALGRVCAHAVFAPENFPARSTAAMDGYAVQAARTLPATTDQHVSFRVQGEIAAGDQPPRVSVLADAWEIMTGAALPAGFDACIRLEDAVPSDDGEKILISQVVAAGTNVRQAAEDFRRGAFMVTPGHRIRGEDILCMTTLGLQTVEVYRPLRVAIIATGKELIASLQPECQTPPIRNSTTPFLLAALRQRGAEATFLGTVSDDPHAFKALFEKADTGEFDLILTTGALSVGRYDFLMSALNDLHADVYFHKVAIRPGKPILFGKTQGATFVMGLPGNPVASVIGLRFFVDHFLRSWFGMPAPRPYLLPLADEAVLKPHDVTSFFRASLCPNTGRVQSFPQQRASLLSPFLQTNFWIEIPAGVPSAVRDTFVRVWPFL